MDDSTLSQLTRDQERQVLLDRMDGMQQEMNRHLECQRQFRMERGVLTERCRILEEERDDANMRMEIERDEHAHTIWCLEGERDRALEDRDRDRHAAAQLREIDEKALNDLREYTDISSEICTYLQRELNQCLMEARERFQENNDFRMRLEDSERRESILKSEYDRAMRHEKLHQEECDRLRKQLADAQQKVDKKVGLMEVLKDKLARVCRRSTGGIA